MSIPWLNWPFVHFCIRNVWSFSYLYLNVDIHDSWVRCVNPFNLVDRGWSQFHNDLSMTLMKTNFEIAKIMINSYNNLDNGHYDMIFNVLVISSTQNGRDIYIYIYNDVSGLRLMGGHLMSQSDPTALLNNSGYCTDCLIMKLHLMMC